MRVLVTGGYGFIGSYVAERFHKEGYEVSILDDLSTGHKQNAPFKHKSYILSVEDRKCEEVFRNNSFDVVVHLAAQVSVTESLASPDLDAKSNVLGLSNILHLAKKYGVSKFIFASSAAVYGSNSRLPLTEEEPCDPISPYGMNKWVGEMYCRKWQEIYGLETLCFRFSNVYGPKQGSVGEGGVISIFLNKLLRGEELSVYGDGEQTRDFIYVEDVADAIYRASYSNLRGIYYLSTNTETSVNQAVELLRSWHGPLTVSYSDPREGDIYRSALDNTGIARHLEWVPKHTFEEGLQKTYDWFLSSASKVEVEKAENEEKSSKLGAVLRFALPYAENLLAFAITIWLTFTVEQSLFRIIDFSLLYIIVLGVIYGNRQSIVAVALSTALFIYEQLANGREIVALLYDTDFFFQIAVYIFIGLVVGYSTERKNILIQSKSHQLETLEGKYKFLNEVYDETRTVKAELQQQIMNNGDSFGKIYSVIKELESLEPEKIFTSTVNVVERIMKAQSVTIYTVNKYGSYLRLVAHSNSSVNVQKSIKVEEHLFAQQLLWEKRLFVNKELKGDIPLIAAPVLNNGHVIAVIAVQWMNFEHFTLYHQNLFKVIVELISSALTRAFSYVEATSSQRYVEGTTVLRREVFADILASKKLANEQHGVEYVLLTSERTQSVTEEYTSSISKSLRETDYIGMGANGEVLVLLTNSSIADANFVLKRFENNGIRLKIVEEDVSNV